jgi:ubiquinone biosynthesis protein
MKKYWRLLYIAYVLLRNRNNIAYALEKLGPAFIKLGQFLSTRPDLVGNDMSNSLAYLRDKLPSFPFQQVKEIIFHEFKQDIEQLYSDFEKDPIAAASISQVHRAVTTDGAKVAVKVTRPKIHSLLKNEIKLFYFLAQIIEKLFPKYKRLKLNQVVQTLENSFKLELDLRLEAAAAEELNEQNDLDYVYIPKVDWLRTGKKILTIEWIEATSICDYKILQEKNIDFKKLATNFSNMFCKQVFVHGFFHADLHQGNIMVSDEGRIILIDFGIMGRLDYNNRIYIAQILNGFLTKDYHLIAKTHQKAGYVSKNYMPEIFAQSCRAIGGPIMTLPPEKISIAKLLAQLFEVTEDFQMETQPQLLLLQKTMIMVEGIGKTLYPESNLWRLSEDWIKEWAKKNISPKARMLHLIKNTVKKIVENLE